MNRFRIALAAILGGALTVFAVPVLGAPNADVGAALGFDAGVGGEFRYTLSDLSPGMPFAPRLGLGWLGLDPGNAEEARRIFINDATDGTAQKHGHRWDARFDAVVPIGGPGGHGLAIFGGPRYSLFSGEFAYIGGNEVFTVTSRQWGWGAGIERSFPIGPRASLNLSGGLDYYLDSRLEGHDTSYDPDGTSINPTHDYAYADADAAIRQPRFTPRLMMGFQTRLGH